tara:strand:- start:2745 stop:2948 length:204 start_codon:yes stop_codon:yes gene_type:complete
MLYKVKESIWVKWFFLLYTNDPIPYSSVSGICSFSNSLIQPAEDSAFSKSNKLVFITSFHSTIFFFV